MNVRTICLGKRGVTYVFRYRPGDEEDVVGAIADLVADANNELDWLDAAMLSFQVAHDASAACEEAADAPVEESDMTD
ncbi:MAG TPA: hypothetical protein DCX07_11530 [Phycisphaerales bacterium]|nr:hypothetical protein [Phycisphaerales bacterium]